MLIYHTTPLRNLQSILKLGILTRFARGKQKVVWLHTQSRLAWAFHHTAACEKRTLDGAVRICVDVPRSWLRRFKRGVWRCTRDIPVARIVSVTGYREVRLSPVEESWGG